MRFQDVQKDSHKESITLGYLGGCNDETIKSHGILLYQGRRPSLLQSLLQSFYLPKFLLNLPSLPFLTLTECDGGWFHWLHQFHWRLRCGFGWWNGYRSRHRGDTRSVLHIFSRFGLLLFLGHPLSLLCTSSVVVTHTMAEIALLHDWCCHCSLFWEAPATAISMERGRAIKEPNFLAKIHTERSSQTEAFGLQILLGLMHKITTSS